MQLWSANCSLERSMRFHQMWDDCRLFNFYGNAAVLKLTDLAKFYQRRHFKTRKCSFVTRCKPLKMTWSSLCLFRLGTKDRQLWMNRKLCETGAACISTFAWPCGCVQLCCLFLCVLFLHKFLKWDCLCLIHDKSAKRNKQKRIACASVLAAVSLFLEFSDRTAQPTADCACESFSRTMVPPDDVLSLFAFKQRYHSRTEPNHTCHQHKWQQKELGLPWLQSPSCPWFSSVSFLQWSTLYWLITFPR